MLKGSGERASSCLKDDWDIEGERNREAEHAEKCWRAAHAIIDMFDISQFQTWKSLTQHTSLSIEDARKAYRAQPLSRAWEEACQEWNKAENRLSVPNSRNSRADDYFVPLAEYVASWRKSAVSVFAILHNGEWQEIGQMGGWGTINDAMDQDAWLQILNNILDSIPGNETLTIVDCHV